MNSVVLRGRLVAKPEIKEAKDAKVVNVTVAVDREGKEGVDFIPLVAFNKSAELLAKYCDKGSNVLVDGQLRANNYEDKDGKKRTSYNVVVRRVEFLDNKKSSTSADSAPKPVEVEVEEEEIPFR